MQKSAPTFLTDLFPELDKELIQLLHSLSVEDWQKPTIARLWTVKDIASHLLDINMRKISILRDGFTGEKPENIRSYADLVNYLNQLNADWVKATKRISPQLLVQLLEQTGREVYLLLKTLDPYERALYAVAWAGEEESQNWFDIARDYTERWHHQQQIRLAVNKSGLMNQKFYYPLLDTFMRALPFAYRHTESPEETLIKFIVTGEGGGNWYLYQEKNCWQLVTGVTTEPDTEVIIPGDIAWRIFTKGIEPAVAKEKLIVHGQPELGMPILQMVAVMA